MTYLFEDGQLGNTYKDAAQSDCHLNYVVVFAA